MKKNEVIITIIIVIITTSLCGCNDQNNNTIDKNHSNNTMNANNETNLRPVANANANPTNGKAPVTVYFSSSGSYDPDGEIITYKWDLGLGGGRVDLTKNPVHTYTEPGNYTVRLIVIDDDNAFSNESIISLTFI